MTGAKPTLAVVEGGRSGGDPVDRIALSLVHPRERIDIPVAAIVTLEAFGEVIMANQKTGEQKTFHHPHVEVGFTQEYLDRIARLTAQIVDEPLELFVAGECISTVAVREPLGTKPTFNISTTDLAAAHALAHKMRTGWRKAGPRQVI